MNEAFANAQRARFGQSSEKASYLTAHPYYAAGTQNVSATKSWSHCSSG